METYLGAIARGDETGCDLETPAYTKRANEVIGQLDGEGGETPDCPERFWQTYIMLSAFDQDFSGIVYTLRRSSTPNKATVNVSLSDGTEETYVLISEGGDWLVNESSTASIGDGATDTETD